MTYDFDTPIDRAGTASLKWDRYRERDVLPMWVADMDFRSPPAVIDALRRRVDHGVFGYTIAPDDLVEAVVERLDRLYGWRIEPDWIVWLSGLVSGINGVCRLAGRPGDAVMTVTPIYPPFLEAPGNMDRQCQRAPMTLDGERWIMDTEAMEAAITPHTRALLLCHPHNPTGRLFTDDELRWVADFCRRHDLLLCSDEIHCDLVLDPQRRHMPTATLSAALAQRTITLMAPSKTYNIAGLSCGFAVIPCPTLRVSFSRAISGISSPVNLTGFEAALAAYRDGDGWLAAVLEYLRVNERLVRERVARWPGVTTTPVEATYLAWLDCRGLGTPHPAAFFEKAGVGLSDGAAFGLPGFVRLNFGCPRGQLVEALDRMEGAVMRRAY